MSFIVEKLMQRILLMHRFSKQIRSLYIVCYVVYFCEIAWNTIVQVFSLLLIFSRNLSYINYRKEKLDYLQMLGSYNKNACGWPMSDKGIRNLLWQSWGLYPANLSSYPLNLHKLLIIETSNLSLRNKYSSSNFFIKSKIWKPIALFLPFNEALIM